MSDVTSYALPFLVFAGFYTFIRLQGKRHEREIAEQRAALPSSTWRDPPFPQFVGGAVAWFAAFGAFLAGAEALGGAGIAAAGALLAWAGAITVSDRAAAARVGRRAWVDQGIHTADPVRDARIFGGGVVVFGVIAGAIGVGVVLA